MQGMRLDAALAARGLTNSRTKAAWAIKEGEVTVNGQTVTAPSRMVCETDALALRHPIARVGRGYDKLERALDLFQIEVAGLRCMDIGASTGGFTQLLLERGAALVYAVDVGAGQLAPILREDPRVLNWEHTDVRTLTSEAAPDIRFAAADLSFISLRLVLPGLFGLLDESGAAVCLIKPQFEVGRGNIGKRGVVKDRRAQEQAIESVLCAARALGFAVCGLAPSPIAGGEGNLEFLLYLRRRAAEPPLPAAWEVVNAAWNR
ncbi:MAG: TlyA family RNA methyltransferase [Oscillospiraceae bacterium]|jgi:23S rRNA (cytidine1920-2'-O)/16S rRNA (cytidine1409-2'-O)-methyltransferase|nr:TlyA family RNA methyltransferase [Oscillospiraceae bacterium]